MQRKRPMHMQLHPMCAQQRRSGCLRFHWPEVDCAGRLVAWLIYSNFVLKTWIDWLISDGILRSGLDVPTCLSLMPHSVNFAEINADRHKTSVCIIVIKHNWRYIGGLRFCLVGGLTSEAENPGSSSETSILICWVKVVSSFHQSV